MMAKVIAVGAWAVALLLVSEAGADYWFCCFDKVRRGTPTISLMRSRISFPDGAPETQRLLEAAASFGPVIGSNVGVIVYPDGDDRVTFKNNYDEVQISETSPDNSLVAQAFRWYSNGKFCGDGPCCNGSGCDAPNVKETDIIFYKRLANGTVIPWSYNQPRAMVDTTNMSLFFSAIAVHEIVHAFGLEHDTGGLIGMSTMAPNYPHGGWAFDQEPAAQRAHPRGNTIRELTILYPDSTVGYDHVALNIFHDPAALNQWWGRALSAQGGGPGPAYYPRRKEVSLPGQNPWVVRQGDVFLARACWGNRGNQAFTGTLAITFALSSNTLLEPSDPRVLTPVYTAQGNPAFNTQCFVFDLVTPNVAPGDYNVMFAVGGQSGNDVGMVNKKLTVVL
jgi:hypothetical protein